jgi:alpha-beta hydrolase superfamily lysophospholipase
MKAPASKFLPAIVAASALFLFACSSPPYLPARDGGDVSAAPVVHAHGTFEGFRGTHLYEQWWRPTAEQPPRATLVVVHGLKDHGARYGDLAQALVARGFAVYALDLRGHGRSEGVRVDIESFDDYLLDLHAFMDRVEAREPGRPLFLFGHSMGGAIATMYAMTNRPHIRGLVLSGAALIDDAGGLKIFGTELAAALTPSAGVFQLDLEKFSRYPAVVKACEDDPLVYQGAAPARMARALVDALDFIHENLEYVDVPLLVMHGGADEVTSPDGSRDLYARAKSADKTLKIYPGLYHDLLHEPERAIVTKDVVEWLSARAAAP